MNLLLKILLFIWQLPQNLVGLFIIYVLNNKKTRIKKTIDYIDVWFVKNGVFKCGVSLGNYILLYNEKYNSPKVGTRFLNNTIHHERGHQKQSKYFGFFYFLFIGLPSLWVNIRNRIFKRGSNWYYTQYPENWADKLGDVHRWDPV